MALANAFRAYHSLGKHEQSIWRPGVSGPRFHTVHPGFHKVHPDFHKVHLDFHKVHPDFIKYTPIS